MFHGRLSSVSPQKRPPSPEPLRFGSDVTSLCLCFLSREIGAALPALQGWSRGDKGSSHSNKEEIEDEGLVVVS